METTTTPSSSQEHYTFLAYDDRFDESDQLDSEEHIARELFLYDPTNDPALEVFACELVFWVVETFTGKISTLTSEQVEEGCHLATKYLQSFWHHYSNDEVQAEQAEYPFGYGYEFEGACNTAGKELLNLLLQKFRPDLITSEIVKEDIP